MANVLLPFVVCTSAITSGSRNDCIPIVLLSVFIFQSSRRSRAFVVEIRVSVLCHPSRRGLKLSVVHSAEGEDWAGAMGENPARTQNTPNARPDTMRRLIPL